MRDVRQRLEDRGVDSEPAPFPHTRNATSCRSAPPTVIVVYATSAARRRARWFRLGAHGIACVDERFRDYYVCPICTGCFTEDEIETELSLEHAPPARLGGVEVALTCRRCNNTAGTEIDVHTQRQQKQMDFISGRGTGSAKITIEREGIPLNATMHYTPGGLLVTGAPKANNPENVRLSTEILDRLAATEAKGQTFNIRINEPYSPRRARLGWVRAAFLASFAWFGYRYVLHPAFNPLRAQLLNPAQDTLPSLPIVTDPSDLGLASERHLAIMETPIEALIVTMGEHFVLLPYGSMPLDFFDTIEGVLRRACGADDSSTGRVQLNGPVKKLPWPDYPRHVHDG